MAENNSTPSGEIPNKPTAPVVPAAAAPAAAPEAKPATETPPAVEPTATAKPTETPPAPAVAAKPTETPAAEPPKPAEEKPAVAPTVPEKYELKLEGDPAIAARAIEAVTPALKAAGLTNDQAQALVESYASYQKGLPALKNAADLEVIRQDPEIGRLNFGATQTAISHALSAFTTPAERQALAEMGMVNDPRLVRMFRRIGLAMSEAPQDDVGARVPQSKTTAQKLYGQPPAEKPN